MLDQVCQQLNLVEKDYFGLRYVDLNKQRVCVDDVFVHLCYYLFFLLLDFILFSYFAVFVALA